MCPVIPVPLRSAEVRELAYCGHGIILPGGRSDTRGHTTCPWLPELRALLRDAVAADIQVLGIFLGHQNLADAGGGEKGPVDSCGR